MCRFALFISKANALSHYKLHITFSEVNIGGGGVAFLARTFAYFRRENYPLSSPADAVWHKLFSRAQFPGRLNSPLWRRRIKNSNATVLWMRARRLSHARTASAFNAELTPLINYAHLIGGVSRPAGPEWSGEGDRVHHEHHLLASGNIFIYTATQNTGGRGAHLHFININELEQWPKLNQLILCLFFLF